MSDGMSGPLHIPFIPGLLHHVQLYSTMLRHTCGTNWPSLRPGAGRREAAPYACSAHLKLTRD